jgi:hypothetical protein
MFYVSYVFFISSIKGSACLSDVIFVFIFFVFFIF